VLLLVILTACGGGTTRSATPEEMAAARARIAAERGEHDDSTTAPPTTTLSEAEQQRKAEAAAQALSAASEELLAAPDCGPLAAWQAASVELWAATHSPNAAALNVAEEVEAVWAEAGGKADECQAAADAEAEAAAAEAEAERQAEEEAEAARLRMTVDEIGKQIESNALRFEREFLGERLEVTGPVDSITTRDDKAYLTLGEWRTAEVICTMRSEAGLLAIEAGDTVTVSGRFDDLANYTEEVELSGCVLR